MLRTVTLLALMAWLQAPQPQPAPTFRSSTRLRVQTATVKDRQGKPLRGLTAKDFVVSENGRPQQVAFVEYQPLDESSRPDTSSGSVPEALSVPDVAGPDPAVLVPGDARYRGRRLIVLYIDLLNMGMFDQLRTFASVDKYLDTGMTGADLVAVMTFQNGRTRLVHDFTGDRAALRDVIGHLAAAADDELNGGGIRADEAGAFGEDDETFNLFSTDRQLAGLQTAVSDLGPLPELKTLVYVGSGLRLHGPDNQAQLRATINAAVRSNVTINPIDSRGLVAEPPLGDATRKSPGGVGMFDGTLAQTAATRELDVQDTYYALAKDTGGRALSDSNDLSRGIVDAAAAVSGYYMIGYYVANEAADGRFRRVTIGLVPPLTGELSYLPGYYAAKSFAKFNATDKERQLEDALRLADPITELPMALELHYFRLNQAEYFVPVFVRMPGGELTDTAHDGSARGDIDMIGEIKDQSGITIRNAKDRLKFTLDAAKAARVSRGQVQYETGFTLLPGQYTVKMLARDGITGRIGTVQRSFTVPNLDRDRRSLPISSVVLGSEIVPAGDALFSVRQKIASDAVNPLIADGRKLVPNVSHTFTAGRPIYVLLQSYEPEATTLHPVVAFAALYLGSTKVMETTPVGVTTWGAESHRLGIRLTLVTTGVEPGVYACQVTVLEPAEGRAAFWRGSVLIAGPGKS